jgi:hypothetical protein
MAVFWKYALIPLCAATLGAYLTVHAARSQHAAPPAGSPKLIIGQTERSLGTVAAGTLLRAEFVLYNAGSRRLIVREDVCSSCDPAEWLIEPGKSADLTIELDTAGLHGELRHVRQYTTSDPRLPRLALTVSATVL